MLIALAQMNATPGDLGGNENAMLSAAYSAQEQGADLIIYSAHCLTGVPLGGLNESDKFAKAAIEHVSQFASICPIPALVSCIVGVTLDEIDQEVNAPGMFLICDGECQFLGVPEFESDDTCLVLEFGGLNFAILLEEHFAPDCEMSDVDVVVEVCANIFEEAVALPAARASLERARSICAASHADFVYVNPVGVNDVNVFAGGTMAMSSGGQLWHSCAIDSPEIMIFDTDAAVLDQKEHDENSYVLDQIECKWDLLTLSIKDYVQKNNSSDVLIALSGGIDSATVATLAVDALGSDHVHAVFLPGPYTSSESFEDAYAVADNLGIDLKTISINDAFDATKNSIEQAYKTNFAGVASENLQARIRADILMSLSNMTSYLVLNTGNKSEAAMGFTTLYGDSVGAYAPLGDLYKMEIYELVEYRNSISQDIPKHIIEKAPSSELYEGAKDSDRLPPYEILDSILSAYIDGHMSAEEIVDEGFNLETVNFVLKSVKESEFKRRQEPISPHLDGDSLTDDRNWPITNSWIDKM